MKALLRAWIEGGERELRNFWGKTFGSRWQAQLHQDRPARLITHSGDSTENAIQVLTDCSEDKVNGEYWYLYYEYGQGWRCQMQMSTMPDVRGRRYDVLDIHFLDGHKKRLYFLL